MQIDLRATMVSLVNETKDINIDALLLYLRAG